jgi:chorismate synthase
VGQPIFDRLGARLGAAMLSIPSAMSFAVGDPYGSWQLPQHEFPDQWNALGSGDKLTLTNHCGGIQGGISNGMPVVFHVSFHSPVTQPDGMLCRLDSGDLKTVAPQGRHDHDHITRLPVIVESMAALTLADLIPLH